MGEGIIILSCSFLLAVNSGKNRCGHDVPLSPPPLLLLLLLRLPPPPQPLLLLTVTEGVICNQHHHPRVMTVPAGMMILIVAFRLLFHHPTPPSYRYKRSHNCDSNCHRRHHNGNPTDHWDPNSPPLPCDSWMTLSFAILSATWRNYRYKTTSGGPVCFNRTRPIG